MTDKTKKPINHKFEISRGYAAAEEDSTLVKYALICSCGYYRESLYFIRVLELMDEHLENRLYDVPKV